MSDRPDRELVEAAVKAWATAIRGEDYQIDPRTEQTMATAMEPVVAVVEAVVLERLVCRLIGHKWLWYGPTFRFDECQRCGSAVRDA